MLGNKSEIWGGIMLFVVLDIGLNLKITKWDLQEKFSRITNIISTTQSMKCITSFMKLGPRKWYSVNLFSTFWILSFSSKFQNVCWKLEYSCVIETDVLCKEGIQYLFNLASIKIKIQQSLKHKRDEQNAEIVLYG